MKKPTLMWLALVMVALLLGGCHPPNYNPPGGGNAAVWIEFPADGQILPNQVVPFVVYATDDGGVAGIRLEINGMSLPVQAPTRLSPDGYMVRLDQTWQPLPPVEGQIYPDSFDLRRICIHHFLHCLLPGRGESRNRVKPKRAIHCNNAHRHAALHHPAAGYANRHTHHDLCRVLGCTALCQCWRVYYPQLECFW